MDEKTFAQNLLMCYMNLKQANECLKALWSFKKDISSKKLVTDINQTQVKISYFIRQIDNTLLSSPNFDMEHWKEIENECFKCLDALDEEIKKL
jgi:hypothetical protein